MENTNLQNNSAEESSAQAKITEFQNAELVVPFIDSKLIMKIAGENKWYVVNEKGDVIVRTRPDGTNEFSEVDLSLESGEPTDIEFGNFIGGQVVVKVTGIDDDKTIVNYIGISPSGYTSNYGNDANFEKEGINGERKYWYTTGIFNSAYRFLNVPTRTYGSLEDVVFRYDVAQYAIVRDFDALEAERQHFLDTGEEKSSKANKTYKRELSKFVTLAKNMRKRYESLLEIVPRQLEKQAQAEERKQEKLEHDTDELKEQAKSAIEALLGPKQE